MDAVGGDDDVGFGRSAIGERHPGRGAVLLESDAAMSGMDQACGQRGGQHIDEVGAVHAERRVPARGVRHLYRRDRRAVVAEVTGIRADPRAPFLHRRFQPNPLQLAHAVGGEKHAGADLADRGRLLIDRDLETLRDKCVGCEQAADPAADDRNTRTALHHQTP